MQKTRANRGTLARGYNKIVKCNCCGHNTQSQIGSGTDLCQECYDFSGEYNSWLDGDSKAIELPQAVRCPHCKAEREAAIAEDADRAARGVTRFEDEAAASDLQQVSGNHAEQIAPVTSAAAAAWDAFAERCQS
jgi:hypothetical protein